VRKFNGTLWGWGSNSFSGQLGDGTLVERLSPVQVAAVSGAGELSTHGQHSLVIASAATIVGLVTMVQAIDLDPGVEHVLLSTLGNAQQSLDAGQANAACGQLGAFGRQVQAFSGRKIAVDDATRLATFNDRVRDGLACR
jgi:hypothetical protein